MGYEKTDQDTSLIILKTDMNGNQIWERRYHCEYTTRAIKILAANNDEYYVAADRVIGKNNLTYGFENLLIKLDDNGDTLFQTLLEKSDDLFVADILFSGDNGVLVVLANNHGSGVELIDVTATGQVLTKTILDLYGWDIQIGEYPLGYRYLLHDHPIMQDSLRVEVLQLDVTGEIVSVYGLIRESYFGKTCFSSEEQKIFWLSSVSKGIRLTKTDLANNVILEKEFQMPGYEYDFIEGIETIGGSNYAYGYYGYDFENRKFFVLKFNGAGDMEKFYPTSLNSLIPNQYFFTGLNNGSLALIHSVDDDIDGGCYALRIYN